MDVPSRRRDAAAAEVYDIAGTAHPEVGGHSFRSSTQAPSVEQ
jgi:hypothetical protein